MEEHVYRTVLVAAWVALFPIGAYHRIRSQSSRERLDRRPEGRFILATLRPAGFACVAAVIAYLVNPALLAWSAVPLPTWLRVTMSHSFPTRSPPPHAGIRPSGEKAPASKHAS